MGLFSVKPTAVAITWKGETIKVDQRHRDLIQYAVETSKVGGVAKPDLVFHTIKGLKDLF